MNLKDIKLSTKAVDIEFPGLKGFVVTLSYVSRETSAKIRDKAKTTKLDPKLKMMVDSLDEDKFIEEFVAQAIKGWKGLTMEHLSTLILIDYGDAAPTDELEFSKENAIELIKGSQMFDTWVNEVIFEIDQFRNK